MSLWPVHTGEPPRPKGTGGMWEARARMGEEQGLFKRELGEWMSKVLQ
jgi:hypothetical protein